MPDGPNIEKLFTETDCLTAQSNLSEICQYLRFFKSEGAYQHYLAKYLPKLAKPEYKDAFDQFIVDLENKDLATELKSHFGPTAEELEALADAEKAVKKEADAKAKAKAVKDAEKAKKAPKIS